MALEERPLALSREEAEVLALALRGDGQAGSLCQPPDLGLCELSQGKAEPRKRGRPQSGQHVGLVLGRIGRGLEQRARAVVGDAGVVTRGERRRPDAVREGDHCVDPQVPVADHARVRRLPRPVAVYERAHDLAAEGGLEIQGQVRNPQRMTHRARPSHRLRGAARLGAVRALVRPELERHSHDVGPAFALHDRGDGGIHAARYGDEHSLAVGSRGERLSGGGVGAQRAGKRVGYELRRVTALRAEPSDQPSDVVGGDDGACERREPLDLLADSGGACGKRRAPFGVESRVRDPARVGPKRDPHEITASGAAGAARVGAGRGWPAPTTVARELSQQIGVAAHKTNGSPHGASGVGEAQPGSYESCLPS